MSFFSNKNKSSYKLFISLKSSSIDFQLVKIHSNNYREVIFVDHNVILLQNSQDPNIYTKQYETELKKMLVRNKSKINTQVSKEAFSIHFVLYTPWFTSKIESVSHAGQVLVDQNFLNTKLKNIKSGPKLEIIEKKILKIQVNGYTLTDFIKIKSSNIKINLYTSSVSKSIFELFKKIPLETFPNAKIISFTTSPVLFLDKIKELMIHEDNVVSIYVGGEITEVSIIKDDSLVYFATFPVGKHDFLRSIQDNIKTFDYDLLSQKQVQLKFKKHQKQFEEQKKKWSESICDVLKNFDQHVPSKILIITDIHTKPFFTELLTNSIQQNPTSELKNHRIINFDILNFKDIISYKNPQGEQELDLTLEALI